jgi:hypothetical protein
VYGRLAVNTLAEPEQAAVCPRCGEPLHDYRYCPRCGLALHAPEVRSLSLDEVVGLALLGGGIVVVLIALFLPWVSSSFFSASFWELSRFADAATTGIGVVVLAAVIADLVTRNNQAIRAVAVLGGMYFVAFLPLVIDEMLQVHMARAGSVVALSGTVIAAAGVVLVVHSDLRHDTEETSPVGRDAHHVLGAIIASAAAALVTLMLLLPASDTLAASRSLWEIYKVNDLALQLVALTLVGSAVTAIVAPRTLPAVLAMLLAAYLSLSLIVISIEFLSYHASYSAEYVGFLAGFAALAASVLLAIQVYPRRG